MSEALRYWHTVRHLRPIQIYGRLWFHLIRPRVSLRPAPAVRALTSPWVPGAERVPSLLSHTRFSFLHEERELAAHGWDDPALDKLWRYHQHYFDDLNAKNAASRLVWHSSLIEQWVRDNPPRQGTGWEPYPTALRIVNWVKWAWRGNELSHACADSLAVQARWLSRRLEGHVLGNHLFANAKALVFAGLYFHGSEAERWLQMGLGILATQADEQILPDGGQFERSTMYHALALEDMLDLCNAVRAHSEAIDSRWQAAIAAWHTKIGPMRTWLAAMCHPDGDIGFFNDAAFRAGPSPRDLDRYACQLGFPALGSLVTPIIHLRDTGYIRLQTGPAVALIDVAPVGPEYLPAHAHADTLSFELSLFGQRLFVNSGTSRYGAGAERLRQRGTAAHNTVVLDRQDSSEVWSAFRVGRRARPSGLEVLSGDTLIVRCAHNGYERLAGRPRHAREWALSPDRLVVHDSISGEFHQAEARFHLHPAIRVHPGDAGMLRLHWPNGRLATFCVTGGHVRPVPSTWHPEFGLSEPNVCLVAHFAKPVLETELRWDGAE